MAAAFPTEAARNHLRTVVFPMTPSRAEKYREACVQDTLTRARAKAEALDVGDKDLVDLRLWRYRAHVRHARYRSRAQSPPPTLVLPSVKGAIGDDEKQIEDEEDEDEEGQKQEVHAGGVMPGCSNKGCSAHGSDAFVKLRFEQRRCADEGMTPVYVCDTCKQEVHF